MMELAYPTMNILNKPNDHCTKSKIINHPIHLMIMGINNIIFNWDHPLIINRIPILYKAKYHKMAKKKAPLAKPPASANKKITAKIAKSEAKGKKKNR